ncbi:cytochrome P450 [Nonomuraea sp. B12E4]|uniref:cytochrome P450 n=1 Tax=Nonomuraea sp. B12E4 TaxID=3153564 RepID=UPI00325F6552
MLVSVKIDMYGLTLGVRKGIVGPHPPMSISATQEGIRMKDSEPITRLITPAGDPAWLVTGYEEVKQLFSDPRLGRSHPVPERAAQLVRSPVLTQSLVTGDTEQADHQRMRRLLSKAFSARRMAALQPRVATLVEQAVEELLERTPPVDFHDAFSFPLPAMVICQLLGVPEDDRDDFRAWCEDMAQVNDRVRAESGSAKLRDYLIELVRHKRSRPGSDVISDLAAAEARAELTRHEVIKYSTMLLFAGHVTTATAIDKGIVLLHENPHQWEALRRDPSLVPPAVEEILRSSLPAGDQAARPEYGPLRYANADFDLAGVTIKAGDLVVLSGPLANLDERVFPDPHRFDIGREDNQHLAFGRGTYFCLGAPLARIELRAVFTTLPRHLPRLRVAIPVERLRRHTGLIHTALTELPVTW